jgi:hypothetical protein
LRGYDVIAACPSEQAFRRTLQQRVSQPLSDAFARVRLELRVAWTADARMLVGRLSVKDAAAVVTTREVESGSCASIIEALSLVAALSADGSPRPELVAAAQPRDQGATSPVSARAERSEFRAGPTLLALMDSAAAPSPALGVGVGINLLWQRQGSWSPWLQLSGERLQNRQRLGDTALESQLELTALNATLCPLQLLAHETWSLRPCVALEGGRITGTGTGSALVQRAARHAVWLSSGLSLRAGVSLWGPLELSTSVGATLPWVRHEFFFAPDIVAFRVPALGWRAAGSVTAMF